MKKKIKDLTLEEMQKICNKHYYCRNCPLFLKQIEGENGFIDYQCAHELDYDYIDKKELEKEVEVDE